MTFKQLLIFLILSISTSLAQARIASDYSFEIIVFEYTGSQYAQTESWPDNPGYPDYSQSKFSISGNRKHAASSQNPDVNFQLLQPDQFVLNKEANIIKRSSARKLLLHTAWKQKMHSKKRAYPINIKIGKSYSNSSSGSSFGNNDFNSMNSPSVSPATLRQVEGTIKISIGRYLHVWTDLLYSRPGRNTNTTSAEHSVLQMSRHKAHRRMRSKELHYIDNPNFGILIYALPIKPKPSNVQ